MTALHASVSQGRDCLKELRLLSPLGTVTWVNPVRVEGGDIVGFEALLRWNYASLGVAPPAEFIPIMEEAGLMETPWII